MKRPSRAFAGALVPGAVLFLSFALASQRAWEPTHDEGITWLQVFGPLDVPRWPETTAVGTLYAELEGARTRGAGDVVDALSTQHGMHPPAYYLLLHAWARIFGGGAVSLRVPGLVAALCTLACVALLARRLVPRRGAAALAVLLLGASPWFVAFSTFARPYGLALCLAVAAQCALFGIHAPDASPRSRRALRVAFAALSLAGVYAIYHYAFVFVWQLVQLATLDASAARTPSARARALGGAVAVALAVAAGYAPWASRLAAHLALTHGERFYFGGAIAPGDAASALVQLLSGFALAEALRTPAAPALFAALSALLVATIGVAVAARLRSRGLGAVPGSDHAARVFWWSTPLLPAGIAAADAWHGTHTLFITKTCFALMPILLLGVVRAWASARSQRVFVAGVAAWIALFAAATASDVAQKTTARSPYRAAAERIALHDGASHLVLLSSLLPGIVDPFVLSLRDADVRGVRVAVVAGGELAAAVRDAIASGRYADVAIVGFDVATTSGAAAPRETFGARAIERAARAARGAGWVVEGPSARPRRGADAGRPTLRVLAPLRGKTLDL